MWCLKGHLDEFVSAVKDGVQKHHEMLQAKNAESDAWVAFATTCRALCDVIRDLGDAAALAEKIAKEKKNEDLKKNFLERAHSLRHDADNTVQNEEEWGKFVSAWRSASQEALEWDDEEKQEMVATAEMLLATQMQLFSTDLREVASGLTDVGGAIWKAARGRKGRG